MGFLSPFLLAGLALVSVPVIIHLRNRQRAARVPFPAIEFLLRSEKKLARRLKVKQLLLLLLRISLFVLLPLAMAQPYLASDAGETAGDRLPTSYVFVLDASFSMDGSLRAAGGGAEEAGGAESFAERARAAIEQTLEGLRPWDRAALVVVSGEAAAPVPELTDDLGSVRAALDALPTTGARDGNLLGAMELARDIHASGDLPGRRTLVYTDGRANAWGGAAAQQAVLASAEGGGTVARLGALEIIDLSEGAAVENLALGEAGFGDAASGSDREYDLWVSVRRYSGLARGAAAGAEEAGDPAMRQARVDLLLDGTLAGSSLVELPPDGEATATFRVALADGALHRAELRLVTDEGDVPADNVRYLTLHLDREVRVLLVNGDPRNVPHRDELFYAERALGAGGADSSGITTDIVGADRLEADFADYDVVVLANVERLPRPTIAALTQFVREGGGLLFTAGNRVDPERYNDLFGELLPKPLRSVRELCEPDDPDAGLLATRVARIETSHPVFRVFDLPGGDSIQSVSVYSYLLLEPSPLGESRILVSYGDGGPALVERAVGAGRVALLTTTLDRDWTDWPIRTAYLPTMRRLVRHLARRGATGGEGEAVVGARFRLDVESQNPERVVIVGPGGERFVEVPEGEGDSVFFTPETPGAYEVLLDISGAERRFDELMFAANPVAAESDTTAVDPALPAAFTAAAADRASGEGAAEGAAAERRVSLWPPLLFLALVALYLESGLATRRRLWTRAAERWQAWRAGSRSASRG